MTRDQLINEELMDIEELATFLKSTSKSIYTGINRGKFPKDLYVKLGRRVLFIRSRVTTWILDGAPAQK